MAFSTLTLAFAIMLVTGDAHIGWSAMPTLSLFICDWIATAAAKSALSFCFSHSAEPSPPLFCNTDDGRSWASMCSWFWALFALFTSTVYFFLGGLGCSRAPLASSLGVGIGPAVCFALLFSGFLSCVVFAMPSESAFSLRLWASTFSFRRTSKNQFLSSVRFCEACWQIFQLDSSVSMQFYNYNQLFLFTLLETSLFTKHLHRYSFDWAGGFIFKYWKIALTLSS